MSGATPMREGPSAVNTRRDDQPQSRRATTTDEKRATTVVANFEYDDDDNNEWDDNELVNINNLLQGLDADIEKTTEGEVMSSTASLTQPPTKIAKSATLVPGSAVEHSATVDKGLKMKIKRTKAGSKNSESKHEIVKTSQGNVVTTNDDRITSSNVDMTSRVNVVPSNNGMPSSSPVPAVSAGKRNNAGAGTHRKDKSREKVNDRTTATKLVSNAQNYPVKSVQSQNASANMGVGSRSNPTATLNGPETSKDNPKVDGILSLANAGEPKSVLSNNNSLTGASSQSSTNQTTALAVNASSQPVRNISFSNNGPPSNEDSQSSSNNALNSPANKKIKIESNLKETKDMCVGTSIGTITEPDCLGPCEPGTTVNLEGIVWQEAQGLLVVNVTWRSKTYVGTLLDCTRHDWAPPRFADSPSCDLDAALPKGRSKRGRNSHNLHNSNFHSKLRSSSANSKARKLTPSSPLQFASPLRPDAIQGNAIKRKKTNEDDSCPSPVADKKPKPPTSPPPSPVMLECPEPNCSKKYRHANGLKYHQSHAHGNNSMDEDENTKESTGSVSENDDPDGQTDTDRKDDTESELGDAGSIFSVEPSPATTPTPDVDASIANTISSPIVSIPPLPIASISNTILEDGPRVSEATIIAETPASMESQPKPTFGVKPASVLMADPTKIVPMSPQQPQRKSKPPGSPSAPDISSSAYGNALQPPFGDGMSRDRISSPGYSDVSDDGGAPILEPEMGDKTKLPPSSVAASEKKFPEIPGIPHPTQHYNSMYNSIYNGQSQPPFLVPSVQPLPALASNDKKDGIEKPIPLASNVKSTPAVDRRANVENNEKLTPTTQHYNQYDYSQHPTYQYNMGQPYAVPAHAMVQPTTQQQAPPTPVDRDANKHDSSKSPSPADFSKSYPSNATTNSVPLYAGQTVVNKSNQIQPNQNRIADNYLKDSSPSADLRNHLPYPYGSRAQTHFQPSVVTPQQSHFQLYQPQQPQTQQPSATQQKLPPQQQQQQQPPTSSHMVHQQTNLQRQQVQYLHHQAQEDLQRFYNMSLYHPEPRRKDGSSMSSHSADSVKTPTPQNPSSKGPSSSSSGSKHKEKSSSGGSGNHHTDDKKEDKAIKQEGVKPTMETQGPPPQGPPNAYTFFPSSYLQASPYGGFALDPNHPMYRGINPMMVPPGAYGSNPYLHPSQMTRYHAPEDLSRPPSGPPTKALDLLHHQASQYYPTHKIHELAQDRAAKSPTAKGGISGAVASSGSQQQSGSGPRTSPATPTSNADRQPPGGSGLPSASSIKTPTATLDGKNTRSPPPQRHVHTHHHTHVGLGYPIITPNQYPASYGGVVLATQQASAVSSNNATYSSQDQPKG